MTRLLALGMLAKEELGTALRRRGTALVWRAVAGLCLFGVLGIGLISLHRVIAEHYGPYWADAALAALFALIALIAVAMAVSVERQARKREHLKATLLAAASVASDALPDKNSALQALIIAALAGGFWFGRKK